MPDPREAMGTGDPGRLRREVLALVGWVIVVDLAFIAGYYALGMRGRADGLKLAYTGCWTVATLAVVLRGLLRVRAERVRRRGRPAS